MTVDYNEVPLLSDGDWLDGAWFNQYLRDNLRAVVPITAAGQILYSSTSKRMAALDMLAGGLLVGKGTAAPEVLAAPGGLGLLQHDGSDPSYLIGGNAYEVLRKNAANDGYEFFPIGSYCAAKLTSNLTGIPTSETEVTWAAYDGSDWRAGSNKRVAAPVDGLYRVSAYIRFTTASVWRNYTSNVYRDGLSAIVTTDKMWSESNYEYTGNHASRLLEMTAGQYVTATVDNCNGSVIAGSWLQLERVR